MEHNTQYTIHKPATFPEGTCKAKMAPVDVNPEEGAAIGAAIQVYCV